MGFMSKMFGSGKSKAKKLSTLDPWQEKLQAAMGQQQLTMFPKMQQNLFDLANAPGGGQFFQNIFANPYLQKRERAWETIQGQMSYGGKAHSASIGLIKGQYERETNMDLLQQQSQMQMGAMDKLFTQSVMNRQTRENVMQPPEEGWLAKAGQVISTASAARSLITGK